jgi:hypothetical protein
VAASFARCIIEDSYYRQSGGAGSGDKPDKAGANCKDRKEPFDVLRVQVRRTPVVPVVWPLSIVVIDGFCRCFLRVIFLFEECIPLLSIIEMSILRWVFLYRESGQICRSRAATVAVPERQNLPVRSGESLRS